MQRSRWRKSKPWVASSTIKRKYPKTVRHHEAKWYLETISSINTNNNTDNTTTKSTPPVEPTTQNIGKYKKNTIIKFFCFFSIL